MCPWYQFNVLSENIRSFVGFLIKDSSSQETSQLYFHFNAEKISNRYYGYLKKQLDPQFLFPIEGLSTQKQSLMEWTSDNKVVSEQFSDAIGWGSEFVKLWIWIAVKLINENISIVDKTLEFDWDQIVPQRKACVDTFSEISELEGYSNCSVVITDVKVQC